MEDTPHANTTNSGNDKHKVLWVGEELDSFSAFFCDSGGEVIEGALESHSDEIENAEEGTTDDDKREDADTEDATEVSREGFAVLKEENSAFQGSFCGVFVFAIEDPTKTTVTKIVDDGLDDTSAVSSKASVSAGCCCFSSYGCRHGLSVKIQNQMFTPVKITSRTAFTIALSA